MKPKPHLCKTCLVIDFDAGLDIATAAAAFRFLYCFLLLAFFAILRASSLRYFFGGAMEGRAAKGKIIDFSRNQQLEESGWQICAFAVHSATYSLGSFEFEW